MATTKIDTSNFQTDVLGSDKPVSQLQMIPRSDCDLKQAFRT